MLTKFCNLFFLHVLVFFFAQLCFNTFYLSPKIKIPNINLAQHCVCCFNVLIFFLNDAKKEQRIACCVNVFLLLFWKMFAESAWDKVCLH